MDDLRTQVITMIQKIKQCYIERKPENIDELQKLLFSEECPPIIIGTSTDEWCFGIEQANELFLSDWKYWGDVSIKMDSLTIEEIGSLAWFHVNAGVEFSFEDSEERYARYMESVRKIAESDKSQLSKTGEITWLLSSLLHSRKQGERKYVWDMTITGMLQVCDGIPKIKAMQFSLPVKAVFPDVRVDIDKEIMGKYQSECKKIKNFNATHSLNINRPINRILAGFFVENSPINFTSNQEKNFIGADGVKRSGVEFEKYISDIKQSGQSVITSLENLIVIEDGENFIFCGNGTISKGITLNKELDKVLLHINRYEDIVDKKEALFKIRRDLTHILKEATLSDNHVSPFRIEGMGSHSDGGEVNLGYAQISYPFYWFLEQKTDAETAL